jgi:hypothetical protein
MLQTTIDVHCGPYMNLRITSLGFIISDLKRQSIYREYNNAEFKLESFIRDSNEALLISEDTAALVAHALETYADIAAMRTSIGI